jgi:hypothetical protein
MTSANLDGRRETNSFAWLAFGFASAIIAGFVLLSVQIGTMTISEFYFRSIEGLLSLILGLMWFFAAFFGIAKGFSRI